jgi:ABC-type sugar transport system ATPase subunit
MEVRQVAEDKAPTLIKAKGVYKEFPGVMALTNVDFDLRPGEVHVLLGENGAGKSTLIKIFSGLYTKDGGQIFVNGEETEIGSPLEALKLGITTIYQEFNLVSTLTVAENIFLGKEKMKHRLIDWKRMFSEADILLESLDMHVDSRTVVRDLGVAEKQMVEIAKALSEKAKILILDEPTAVLTAREIEKLFSIIKNLRNQGVGIIYISHRLDEIPLVGDRVTVLRDGALVGTIGIHEGDQSTWIRMMVGRELKDKFPARQVQRGKELLRVENLSRRGVLDNISFTLHRGEILGIAGLVGAGRTELGRALFGADKISEGKIFLNGKATTIASPSDAIDNRICYLPEDRKTHGVVLILSVRDNLTLPSLGRLCFNNIINRKKEKKLADEYVAKLQIRTPSLDRKVMFLSGGNQQKVFIAKWLCAQSDLFIFDEPTRGIDVGAKVEVYYLMNELVRLGAGIVMISSELPEILGMSDHILVMRKGRITGEFDREGATQEKILSRAWGN